MCSVVLLLELCELSFFTADRFSSRNRLGLILQVRMSVFSLWWQFQGLRLLSCMILVFQYLRRLCDSLESRMMTRALKTGLLRLEWHLAHFQKCRNMPTWSAFVWGSLPVKYDVGK